MKRRKEVPAMPPGYMAALGKLYGKQPIAGPESALESTQTTGALPMHRERVSDMADLADERVSDAVDAEHI